NQSVARAEEALQTFPASFQMHYLGEMRAKLGLEAADDSDISLIDDLLKLMEQHQADYTKTFCALIEKNLPSAGLFQETAFKNWHSRWLERSPSLSLLQASNPVVIPRNHRVEEALAAAVDHEDFSVLEKLLAVLRKPYEETEQNAEFRAPPPAGGECYKTFCGT
ncbi:MAG: protein adenylyltransferase SelO family protein, partial [Bdellovibrionota bacterium]